MAVWGLAGVKPQGHRTLNPSQHHVQAVLSPCEGTANPEIQLLAGIHRQSFVAIGLSQVIHGIADVCVGDGTEFSSVNRPLRATRFVHDRENSIKNLRKIRNVVKEDLKDKGFLSKDKKTPLSTKYLFLWHCFPNSARCHVNACTDKPEQYLCAKAHKELTKLKGLFTIQQLLGANQSFWLRTRTFTSAAAAPFGEHVPVSIWVYSIHC